MFCLLIGFTHGYVLLSCHFYIHTLFTGSHQSILRHLNRPKGWSWSYPYINISPYPYTSSPGKISHTAGVYVPTLYEWVLLLPTRTWDKWKCCETGPMVFLPLSRRLENLRRLHLLSQRQHFLHSYFEPATYRSADRRSPNWADQCL